MLVSLYTLPNCEESELTRKALRSLGIPFTERSAADTSPPFSPVVAMVVNSECIGWHGHQPELLELLADLLADGPIPFHGLTDFEQAESAVLTRKQAADQIEAHGLYVPDFFRDCGEQPLYRGSVLLNWLGY